MLYDSFFKEIMNPETTPERLEEFLSLVLKQKVTILKVLPNDSTRIADESSLLIMDIVVELADGSMANVEVQKVGYAFHIFIFTIWSQKVTPGYNWIYFRIIPLSLLTSSTKTCKIRVSVTSWMPGLLSLVWMNPK